MTRSMMHLAAAAVILLSGLAGPARAEIAPDQLAGRWVSAKPPLMLDIARCGKGWCGVQVNDGACAHTALKLEVTQRSDQTVMLDGTLLLAVGSKPYQLHTVLRQRNGVPALDMFGNTEGRMMRIYEFSAKLARTGEASCAVDQKVS